MSNQSIPKLTASNFPVGTPQIISFSSALPKAEGDGAYGHWKMWEVVVNNTEYAFFPSKGLLPSIEKLLPTSTTLVIERIVKPTPSGYNQTLWYAAIPGAATPQNPASQKFEADLNKSTMHTLQKDKDAQITRSVALKASTEFHAARGGKVEDVLITAEQMEKWLSRP